MSTRVIVVGEDELLELVRRVIRDELGQREGYISVREAAEVARVHPSTVRTWQREGHLPVHRAGRRVRVLLSELRALLANPPRSGDDPNLPGKLIAMSKRGGA